MGNVLMYMQILMLRWQNCEQIHQNCIMHSWKEYNLITFKKLKAETISNQVSHICLSDKFQGFGKISLPKYNIDVNMV